MVTRIALLLVIVFVPPEVFAQSPPLPTGAEWDITASSGLFAAYRPPTEGATGYEERWFHAVQAGVTVGRYLGKHLKLELEASTTTAGTLFRERAMSVPGVLYPHLIGSEVTTSIPSVGAAVTWQFRDNEWVHPFVEAGVAADFDRSTVRTWEHFVYDGPPGTPPRRDYRDRREGPTTARVLRGVVGGGAKVYFTPRAFVRTDGRWSFDRERHNVALRLGVGVDF